MAAELLNQKKAPKLLCWVVAIRFACYDGLMTDEIFQPDESLLRFSASAGDPLYEAVQSLEEAQRQQGFSLIMEGDYGGQIYLTCPVGLLACDHKTLVQ
ncbi:MAG: hypothetical protein WC028_11750 [Candidatus Obscuribacterales bacterium]